MSATAPPNEPTYDIKFDHSVRVLPDGQVEDLDPTTGLRRRKVSIVGFASSTRLKAPFDDPAVSIWAMNQLYRYIPRASRWWEMHQRDGAEGWLADTVPGTDYLGWLAACPIPVHMIARHADIPNSVAYPIDAMIARFGSYFHSSVSYMLAQAIAEGFEDISIYGIDMAHDSEYIYQKAACEYLIGWAKGAGIRVTIPALSSLLKPGWRYGYDPFEGRTEITKQIAARRAALAERRQQLLTEMNAVDGALQENAHWEMYTKHSARGAHLIPAST